MRSTGVIRGSQLLKQGEVVILAIDIREIDDQSFTISSGTLTIEDQNGEVVDSIEDVVVTVTEGIGGRARVQYLLSNTNTAAMSAGIYVATWTLTLADTQTRIMRQAIQVVVP